ncbi:MAG: hypothetical protein H0T42_03720 [Deltaproteobacteria bacterium]|nr:hypothetical protein [Deltaproteobacteria bacterium]
MNFTTWQPPYDDPTRNRTPEHVNRSIDKVTRQAIDAAGDSPVAIHARLAELDREWHLDRALMALLSVLGSFTASRAMKNLRTEGRLGTFGLVFWAQMGFLLQHAIGGWCPPVAVLRRLGFRTAREINSERVALETKLAFEDGA